MSLGAMTQAHPNTTMPEGVERLPETFVPIGETVLFAGMSNHEYHLQPHLSKSGLDKIARAPAVYRYETDNPPEPTDAMRKGTVLHTAVLEPERFRQDYVVAPVCDRRTAQGKAVWSSFLITAGDKEVLTADEHALAVAMRDAIHAHPAAAKALRLDNPEGNLVEASLFSEIDGVPVRCRPDLLRNDGLIVDVKTTKNASPDEFAKSIANYRYHVQAAYYSDIVEKVTRMPRRGFVFIAVETVPPYLVAVYVASDVMMFKGRELYQRDLAVYRRCKASGEWPGYPDFPMEIDLPRWAL